MPTIAVTGATGHLGRLVVAVPAGAGGRRRRRRPRRRQGGRGRAAGAEVRVASYDDRAALEAAFAGVDTLVLVSGSEVGQRVAAAHQRRRGRRARPGVPPGRLHQRPARRHHHAGAGARAQGDRGGPRAAPGWPGPCCATTGTTRTTPPRSARRRSRGVLLGSAHDGRIASASRRDYAEAAAAVAVQDGHENRVYELAGDVAWTLPSWPPRWARSPAARSSTAT